MDGFHFVWKKVSGDVSLTADVKLADAGPGASPHRKALLMFRQTLDPDAMYADAAIHGSGETALQYRRNPGDTTQDIAFNIGAPQRLRLEKRGDTITLFLSAHGEPLHQVGASIRLHFDGDFYAGLGICAHNKDAVEQATFAHVELEPLMAPATPAPMALYSTLQTIAIDDKSRMAFVIQTGKGQMEAPNWSRDGKTLIFNRDGKLWSVPASEGDGSVAAATLNQHRQRQRLHRQPRPIARRQMACDDLHHARPSWPARLYCACSGRRAAHRDGESRLLLS